MLILGCMYFCHPSHCEESQVVAACDFIAHLSFSVVPPILRLVFSGFAYRKCYGSTTPKSIRLSTRRDFFPGTA